MSDETPIVVNIDDDYDEDDHDPATCDDLDCVYAPEYFIEITRTVRFTIHAHTDQAANEAVWGVDAIDVKEPEGVSNFEDDGDDATVTSEQELRRQQAETRRFLAEIEARDAAEAVGT